MSKSRLRVLIVDDSPIARAAIKRVLEAEGDIEVVGEAEDGEVALELIESLRPDLATVDIYMPKRDGLALIEEIMARYPMPLLVVTGRPSGERGDIAFEAVIRGALDVNEKPVVFDPDGAAGFRARVRSLSSTAVVKRRFKNRTPAPDRSPTGSAEPKKLRVLVVDDSSICRAAMTEMLEAEGDIEVIGEARDGDEAYALSRELHPDLATMDLQMPGTDGFEAIERIMADQPLPVLVVSALVESAADNTAARARAGGALDVMPRPVAETSDANALRNRVRQLASVPVVRHISPGAVSPSSETDQIPALSASRARLIAIAASAGGPAAIARLVAALPASYPIPIAVVQHVSPSFSPSLVAFINSQSRLKVVAVENATRIEAGHIYMPAPDQHLKLVGLSSLAPGDAAPLRGHRPAADIMLESVARYCGDRSVGVVLTGMGDDGANGLLEMRKNNALTIAQDFASSVVDGMPRAARERGAASLVLSLDDVIDLLLRAGELAAGRAR